MEDDTSISIEIFISLIEERPNLWDKSLDMYKNKVATQNSWRDIFIIIYPDFETWEGKKRQEYGENYILLLFILLSKIQYY